MIYSLNLFLTKQKVLEEKDPSFLHSEYIL